MKQHGYCLIYTQFGLSRLEKNSIAMRYRMGKLMNANAALARAIELTREILTRLDADQLEPVGNLELRRKRLIEQAFNNPIESIDPVIAQHLRNLNQQVVDKLTLFKQSIVLQQARHRTGARASRAYLDNDSGPI